MARGQRAPTKPGAPPSAAGVNFKSLLKGKAEEAVRPPKLPAGQYLSTIMSFVYGKSRKKQTPFVDFNWNINAASDEIDAELLVDAEGNAMNVEGKKIRSTFYITPDAMWRLKDFFESVVGSISGRSFEELISDSPGTQAWLDVSQVPTDDGEDVFNEVVGYANTEAEATV